MLIDRDAIAKVIDMLEPDDFYKEAHRAIYMAICDLFEKGEPADLVTVTEALREQDKLDRVGGAVYVANLANSVPTAANVEYYAKIVKDRTLLRGLIKAGTAIAASAYDTSADVEVVLDEAEKAIFQIAQKRSIQSYTDIKRVLVDAFERIEYLYTNKGGITGVPVRIPRRTRSRRVSTIGLGDYRRARHGKDCVCTKYRAKHGFA